MSIAIDIPDRLADMLRTLAIQRGVSIEELVSKHLLLA